MLRRPLTAILQARLARPLAPQAQPSFDLAIRTFSHAPRIFDQQPIRRPGRPKGVVGEPSRPVKRAVKRNAQKPASSGEEDAAAGKTAERKKTAAAKKKKSAAAASKKPTKVLTEEQRASKLKRLQSKKVFELKKVALAPPKISKSSAYMQFSTEHMRGLGAEDKGRSPQEIRNNLAARAKAVGEAWRALTAADIEVRILSP